MVTIDASVWVSAYGNPDMHSLASAQFIIEVQRQGVPVWCPTLVLPECSGAIARATGSPTSGPAAIAYIQLMPSLQLVSLTTDRALVTARLAADHRLRGADAAYVAVAQAMGTTLVTWDNEMPARGPAVVATVTPSDWWARNVPP